MSADFAHSMASVNELSEIVGDKILFIFSNYFLEKIENNKTWQMIHTKKQVLFSLKKKKKKKSVSCRCD